MIFRTYKPKHPLLRQMIQTFWYIEHRENSVTDMEPKMFPDGCYHMVFNLAVPHDYVDKDGRIYRPASSHMNAKQTELLKIRREGEVRIMGAIFEPYGLYAFLRTPACEIAGSVWDIEDLLGSTVREIEERLQEVPMIEDKFAILEHTFASYIQQEVRLSPTVLFACQRIIESRGTISIAELTSELQLSERSVERQFKMLVGITPKQFADIQRMRDVLKMLNERPEQFIHIAHAAKFYDQSHFNHTFKKMLGITPQQYVHNRDLLSDIYNTAKRDRGMIDGNTIKE